MINSALHLPAEDIIAFCQRNPAIRKLSLFGSVLRDDSDVDVLVEFERGAGARIGRELEALVRRD
jgi:predicted nucleotidyltransferase